MLGRTVFDLRLKFKNAKNKCENRKRFVTYSALCRMSHNWDLKHYTVFTFLSHMYIGDLHP